MRVMSFVSAALVLSMSGPAFAQEWAEYVNREDGFKVDFPGQPTVESITYISEFGYPLPARVYTATRGDRERYSVTVVDYSGIERLGMERVKTCPEGAEACIGGHDVPLGRIVIGPGYSRQDVRGAITYATFKLLQRDAKLTFLAWHFTEQIEGHLVQLTNNADQSLTFAAIHMHKNKLYILEGTVPKGYPPPGLFQQSLGFVDREGNGIRYQTLYSNAINWMHEPPPYHPKTQGTVDPSDTRSGQGGVR